MEKSCSFCNVVKLLEDFGICKHAPDGRTAACKKCRNEKYYHQDKERSKKRNQEWTRNNRERSREIKKRYELRNKNRISLYHKKRREEFKAHSPWILIYQYVIARVTNKSTYYYQTGVKNNLTREDVKKLYIRDKAWELKKPSLDRINGFKDYSFDNCRIIELRDNQQRKKQSRR